MGPRTAHCGRADAQVACARRWFGAVKMPARSAVARRIGSLGLLALAYFVAGRLGLMLERPMFTEFNKKAVGLGREAVDFAPFEEQIQKFKDEHIYRRMFEVEEKENS